MLKLRIRSRTEAIRETTKTSPAYEEQKEHEKDLQAPKPRRNRRNRWPSPASTEPKRSKKTKRRCREERRFRTLFATLAPDSSSPGFVFTSPGQTHRVWPQALTTSRPHGAPPCRGGARRTRTHDSGLTSRRRRCSWPTMTRSLGSGGDEGERKQAQHHL